MQDLKTYDAAIIGGGHNGLVCGAYLARAGHSVVVLERRHILGGASVTEEIWPGYFVNTAAHMLGMLQPKIILDLELGAFGYEVVPIPSGIHLIEGVGPVVLWTDVDKLCAEFARFSKKDAQTYPAYLAHLANVAQFFRQAMWEIPPDPTDFSIGGLSRLAGFAWRNRKALSKFHAISDLLAMSAYDYLARWFESDQVRIILGYYPAGAAGQSVSVHTPGTAYFLLRNFLRDNNTPAGGIGLARGGMGCISQAIAKSGARFGLEMRTDADVEEVMIEQGRAVGVRLRDGNMVRAKAVVCNAAVQNLVRDLLPAETLPEADNGAATRIRSQSTTFKIHLAVDAPIPFAGLKEAGYDREHPVQVTLAPSIAYMERAYHEMQLGQLSQRPYMTIQTPTLADPTLAPAGKHMLSIYGGHVPSGPGHDHGEEMREHLFRVVMDTISIHAPEFDRRWSHRQIMLASDYEEIFGLPGGSPHHGDMTLDQLFFRRPLTGMSNYATAVPGLFICGASAHPGGGVTGVPGHNAAIVVNRSLRMRRMQFHPGRAFGQ